MNKQLKPQETLIFLHDPLGNKLRNLEFDFEAFAFIEDVSG